MFKNLGALAPPLIEIAPAKSTGLDLSNRHPAAPTEVAAVIIEDELWVCAGPR
jgi:hypothetical protein